MSFKLSQRSLDRLIGVDERLVAITKLAITYTKIDFGVTCGLRDLETQKKLVLAGKSQTMKSKHVEGLAVDVVAWVAGEISWESNLYDDIADAFVIAAKEVGAPIRWGAAWHIPNIVEYKGTMENAMMEYIDLRRSQGRRPFVDGPHFEINDAWEN